MMRQIKSRDTKPELAVRRALHALGYRFRTCQKNLPGKPDLVFSQRKHVVFVHGCFFHRHQDLAECPRARRNGVQSNVDFWLDKFEKNKARDVRNRERLESAGWSVHVVWECETGAAGTIDRLAEALGPPRWRR